MPVISLKTSYLSRLRSTTSPGVPVLFDPNARSSQVAAVVHVVGEWVPGKDVD